MGKKAAKKACKAASMNKWVFEEFGIPTTEGGELSQEVSGYGNEQASDGEIIFAEPPYNEQEALLPAEEPPQDQEPPQEQEPPQDQEPPQEQEPPQDQEPPQEQEPPQDQEPPREKHAILATRTRPFEFAWDVDYGTTFPSSRSLKPAPRVKTPSTSTIDDPNDSKVASIEVQAVIEPPSIQSTLVARCRSCARMAWFQSPSRHLAAIAVAGAKEKEGVVFMRCGRCSAVEYDRWGGKKTKTFLTSIDVCPKAWRGSDVLRIAESLAGREMQVLGNGSGGTAVIDLLSLTRELLDDEEWGEVLEADYHTGKRARELCSKTIKGGLI